MPLSGPLPRVSYWSVWNEPNQPGWLSPQWQVVGGARVMFSPVLYRRYVDAAWNALDATGHTVHSDTILVGELAPEGGGGASPSEQPIDALGFLRALYCVDASYRPLTGSAAAALGCPGGGGGGSKAFASAHPGLFDATGFAHHPYSFFLPPSVGYPSTQADAGFVPLIELSRLEHALDSIYSAYGVSRKMPIYLTEYGYETNPPNPFRGVSLQRQAQYIDEAQYMASQDPRVRSMSQFLLYDALPNPSFPPGTIGYWSTFQTGLQFANGTRKPSFYAYQLPIWIPSPGSSAGGSVLVWGMLRPAPHNSSTARADRVAGSHRRVPHADHRFHRQLQLCLHGADQPARQRHGPHRVAFPVRQRALQPGGERAGGLGSAGGPALRAVGRCRRALWALPLRYGRCACAVGVARRCIERCARGRT